LAASNAHPARGWSGQGHLPRAPFGYFVTLCSDAGARCPSVFPGMGHRVHWALKDPAAFAGTEEETLHRFRQVRDHIGRRIAEWLAEQDDAGWRRGCRRPSTQGLGCSIVA